MAPLLSLIFLLPAVVAFLLLAIPNTWKYVFKWTTLVVTGLQFISSLVLACAFNKDLKAESWSGSFQYTERTGWIHLDFGFGGFKADYFIGVDGISLPLVLLATFILIVGVLSSWHIQERIKSYYFLYLLLSTSIVGCFIALDLFLFYICFEFMLLPIFLLIGIWGGSNRSYASIKFFLYTLLGSLFILVVMIGLYQSTMEDAATSFNLTAMLDGRLIPGSLLDTASDHHIWGLSFRFCAFLFLLIGFGIKLPFVPFHTWLPDAHVEAPTPISVLLAGLLLKVGGYGLYRMAFGIFPDIAVEYQSTIAVIGVVSILYGGLNALAQSDLKKLVAYSSISHMGFVLVGLSTLTLQGFSGGVFHMISHGLISPALFILVGIIYDRTHNRAIENFSGLAVKMPRYTFFIVLFFFAGLGLPGLAGFVGELMVLLGTFASQGLSKGIALLSIGGMIISAGYFLWVIQRMFFGKYFVREFHWDPAMKDLDSREVLMLMLLGVPVLLLGIFPSILLDYSQQTLELLTRLFTQ